MQKKAAGSSRKTRPGLILNPICRPVCQTDTSYVTTTTTIHHRGGKLIVGEPPLICLPDQMHVMYRLCMHGRFLFCSSIFSLGRTRQQVSDDSEPYVKEGRGRRPNTGHSFIVLRR